MNKTALLAIAAEMRGRLVGGGKHTSPTLLAWAERIEKAISDCTCGAQQMDGMLCEPNCASEQTPGAAQVADPPKHDEGWEALLRAADEIERGHTWITAQGASAIIRKHAAAIATQPAARRVTDRQAEVIAFLLGDGPLEGLWFGDEPFAADGTLARARYWWRKPLRKSFAQPAEGVSK